MGKGVFIHRSDSIQDDSPAERYQFPHQYFGRVSACVVDWIIYYEPSKIQGTRGYFAAAKVAQIVPDPKAKDMYLALIEPGMRSVQSGMSAMAKSLERDPQGRVVAEKTLAPSWE